MNWSHGVEHFALSECILLYLCQQNDMNIFRAVCFSVACFSEIYVRFI